VSSNVPSSAGWYPDPYTAGQVRWFDGTEWTIHAVASSQPDPDQFVEKNEDVRTPEQMRQQEWQAQFPWWDTTAVAQGDEPPFDFRGGATGFDLNQAGRFYVRLGNRLKDLLSTSGWVLVLAVVLFGSAWFDSQHRVILAALGGLTLALSLGLKVRANRTREEWERVGREG
jgi:hypothetical protein